MVKGVRLVDLNATGTGEASHIRRSSFAKDGGVGYLRRRHSVAGVACPHPSTIFTDGTH
jgi:hypothetical protein